MRRPALFLALALGPAAPPALAAGGAAYAEFEGERLRHGRRVWLDNCEGCHGYGVGGAPVPLKPKDWAARLRKPASELHQHAIEGFFGPDDTLMPARGGNPSLSDEAVRAAVDYMLALARHHSQPR
jgi:cytochrome c5